MTDITIDWLSFLQSKDSQTFSCNFKTLLFELCADYDLPFETREGNYNQFNLWHRSYAGFSIYEHSFTGNILVQCSGDGCRFIDKYCGGGLYNFIKYVYDSKCRVTRLDLASDDKDGILNLRLIESKFNSGMWTGSARHFTPMGKKDKNGEYVNGVTYYVGTRKSNCMVRIYDKSKQMEVDGHWVRVELELHDDYASEVVQLLSNEEFKNINSLYSSLVLDRVCFLSYKDSNNNYEYNRTCPWWTKFLNGCTVGHHFTRGDDDLSLNRMYKWVMSQCSNSITTLFNSYGPDILNTIISRGELNMNKRQKQLVSEYIAELNARREQDKLPPIQPRKLTDKEMSYFEERFNNRRIHERTKKQKQQSKDVDLL